MLWPANYSLALHTKQVTDFMWFYLLLLVCTCIFLMPCFPFISHLISISLTKHLKLRYFTISNRFKSHSFPLFNSFVSYYQWKFWNFDSLTTSFVLAVRLQPPSLVKRPFHVFRSSRSHYARNGKYKMQAVCPEFQDTHALIHKLHCLFLSAVKILPRHHRTFLSSFLCCCIITVVRKYMISYHATWDVLRLWEAARPYTFHWQYVLQAASPISSFSRLSPYANKYTDVANEDSLSSWTFAQSLSKLNRSLGCLKICGLNCIKKLPARKCIPAEARGTFS